MFASHAINQGCLVTFVCFTTASSNASFLGAQPSECECYTEKTRSLVTISSFLNLCSIPKNISHFPLYLLIHVFSALQADPFSKVHLKLLASFFISFLSSPFGCFHLCGVASVHLFSLICTSGYILITASVLLCGPSAAALTLSQFCPTIRKRKSQTREHCDTGLSMSPNCSLLSIQCFLSPS